MRIGLRPARLLGLAVLLGTPFLTPTPAALAADGTPAIGPALARIQDSARPLPLSSAQRGTPAIAPQILDLFLEGNPDLGHLSDLGVRIGTRSGDVLTARAPRSALTGLLQVQGLSRITLASPVRPLMDISIPEVNGDVVRVRNGSEWSGRTGSGVIIGLVDSGLDITHGDFLHPDGASRVLWYWDQTDLIGPAPTTQVGSPLFDYGSEWSQADLDAGISRAVDPVGHGTHVAGIAAGDGSDAAPDSLRYRYPGVAPEADIIVVAADLFLETGVLDAVNYVFTKAAELGKPAVVNLSLGGHFGPHDGTGPLDQGLDGLVGPGRLAVVSAGNDGITLVHAEIIVPPGGSDSASVFVPPYTPHPILSFFVVEAFYRAPDALDVTLVSPGGSRFGPYPLETTVSDMLTGEGTLFLSHIDSDPVGSNLQVQFDLSDFNPDTLMYPTVPPPASGTWWVVFTDKNAVPAGGEVDLWVPAGTIVDIGGLGPRWTSGFDPTEEITTPGSAARAVTVGSFNTKRCWPDTTGSISCSSLPESITEPGLITYFSSHGPTRDDREKPDLVAPGFVIASAFSQHMSEAYRAAFQIDRTLDPDRRHFVFAGTSMSTPHVTGALALLLQAEPMLTPEEAQVRLRDTVLRDEVTGPDWDNASGNGKLDITALLDTLQVPVVTRNLILETSVGGAPVLGWSADPEDAISGFRLDSRAPKEAWRFREEFSGSGPHRWEDPAAPTGIGYRIWARARGGETALWAETVWNGPEGKRLVLGLPKPNPFRSETRLPYSLAGVPSEPLRSADVFDASGRRVRSLLDGAGEGGGAGFLIWDGRDDRGRRVSPGVYWVHVRTAALSSKVKLVRLP